jgi:hypothetical protein
MDIGKMFLHGEAIIQPMRPHLKLFNKLFATLLRGTFAMRAVRTSCLLILKLVLIGLIGTPNELKLPELLLVLHLADDLLELPVLLS